MGFTDHTMYVCEESKLAAVCALAEKLGLKEKEFLIVVYGKTVTDEEKEKLNAYMGATYPNVETYAIDGGQDVYDFLLIIE